jgi:TonB-dependent SusC/RagA subfamily outer membrane receptor
MMRSRAFVISAVALCACASDRSITGPVPAPAPSASALTNGPFVIYCGRRASTQPPPYYVVDGRLHAPGTKEAVEGLNPADIEAIEILKGAAAAAVYGRGAVTGVIVITTRKASKSRAQPAS